MKQGKLLLTLLTLMALAAAPVMAQDFGEAPAFIDREGGTCSAYSDAGMVYTNDTRFVVTNDPETGNVHMKCRFDGNPTLSGKAWKASGFMCCAYVPNVGLWLSMDSSVKQSANGKMTLTCHFNNDDPHF